MANGNLCILIADGELSETRPLRMDLRRRGARVLMADTREQALRLAGTFRPDLFIIGDRLEGNASREVVSQLQATHPEARMIVLASESPGGPDAVGPGILFMGIKTYSNRAILDLIGSAFPDGLSGVPAAPASKPVTILEVDDDPAALRAMSRILGRHGYKVREFGDPKAALKAIPEILPDLAILDVRMPGMDGRELAREIRKHYQGRFPVVMVSALASNAEMAAGYRHGADYYLPKPYQPRELLDIVDYYAADLDPEERDFIELRCFS